MAVSENPIALLSRLSGARYGDYLYQPIPSDLDDDVLALVGAYQAASPDDQASIRKEITGESADALECFAERQAVVAVRTESLEPIRLGLLAVGMCFPRPDKREAFMALVKLDHSSRLLGADLADLAEEMAKVLPDSSRYFLAQFLARADRGDSLLSTMGFATYGTGSEFVYDNAVPGAPSAAAPPPVQGKVGGSFVARQRYTSTFPGDPAAIRVKDGALVVTDERARRSVFPLTGPDAPGAVVRAFKGTDRWWVVTDRQGRAIVSAADDDWGRDAFAGVAEAAGIPFDRDALAPGYALPAPRPDHVDLSRTGRSGWLTPVGFIVVGLLALYALIGLWAGYPWLWAVLWGSVGTWWNTRDSRDNAVCERNIADLPADERPVTPRREIKLGKAFLGLAAFALGPTALAYLIRDAGPLP